MASRSWLYAPIGMAVGFAIAVPVFRTHPVAAHRMPDTHGEFVTYAGKGGDSVKAYIGFPERPDAAPAMVVIHEIFGQSEWVESVVDTFAARGYVAIAPDLLTRHGGTIDATSARKVISTLPPDSITVDLDATVAYLRSLKSVRGDAIGVIGFCWGGGQSFRYATNNPTLKAAVVCYGPHPDSASIARIAAPVLGVYAGNDARIDATLPDAERLMQAAGKSYHYQVYPGAGHGFLRSRNAPEQADTAWMNIMAFLKTNLPGSR